MNRNIRLQQLLTIATCRSSRYIFFVAFYSLLFIKLWSGAGNYWDWSYPYFSEHGANLVNQIFSAWQSTNLGSPLVFATGSPYNLLSAGLTFLIKPEYSQMVLLVLSFAIASSSAYNFFRRKLPWQLSLIFALSLFINPAIFYKLLGGHLLYLASYSAFICLFACVASNKSERLTLFQVAGVLLISAVTSLQIQFLIFTMLLILVCFLFNRKKWGLLLLLLPVYMILVNAHWMLNYIITDSSSLVELGIAAKAQAFDSLLFSSWKGILTLSFSSATFIRDFYPRASLYIFSLLYIFCFGLLAAQKINKDAKLSLSLLLIFMFLATGLYQTWEIPIVSSIFPMLRESGHSAPLVVLFLVTTISLLVLDRKWIVNTVTVYMLIFLSLNIWIISQQLPTVNFNNVRNSFQTFEDFNATDDSTYRILTYPFFNQYSIDGEKTKVVNGQPKSNSGWDSFTMFSGKEYIENAISPDEFKDSIQYKFLQNYDVALLAPLNIKYIYDYSNIYQSNYYSFVSPEVYDNNTDLIKNDHMFLEKVLNANPGKTKWAAPNVVEITNFAPRVISANSKFKRLSNSSYQLSIKGLADSQSIELLTTYNRGWKLTVNKYLDLPCEEPTYSLMYRQSECSSSDNVKAASTIGYRRPFVGDHIASEMGFNEWLVGRDQLTSLPHEYYKNNTDGSIDVVLNIEYRPQDFIPLGWIISLLSILAPLGFILYGKLRSRKTEDIVP